VVVMNGGRIEQAGAPLELYDHPRTLFVAAFIGSPQMNFLRGRLRDPATLELPDGTSLALPRPAAEAGREVVAGVRPEHLELAGAGWPAEVVVVEPTGSETQLTLRMAGQVLRLLLKGRTGLAPHDTVHLSLRGGDLHVFDADSGGII